MATAAALLAVACSRPGPLPRAGAESAPADSGTGGDARSSGGEAGESSAADDADDGEATTGAAADGDPDATADGGWRLPPSTEPPPTPADPGDLCADPDAPLIEACPDAVRCDDRGCELLAETSGGGGTPTPIRCRGSGGRRAPRELLRVAGTDRLGSAAVEDAVRTAWVGLACCLEAAAGEADRSTLPDRTPFGFRVCIAPDGTAAKACAWPARAAGNACVRDALARLRALHLDPADAPAALRGLLEGYLPFDAP